MICGKIKYLIDPTPVKSNTTRGKMVDQSIPWTTTESSPKFTIISSICTMPLFKNKEFLSEKYEVEGLSARQIALLIGCSHSVINRALESFGITKTLRRGGWVEFGWKMKNGKLVKHIRQQMVIQQMLRKRFRGWSYSKIATWLNAKGIESTSSKSMWYHTTVARIVSANSKKPL